MTIIKELDALHVNGEEYKFPAGEGDMKYADFSLVEKTGATITLDLFSYVEPSANFTINAPSEIKEGQAYILRVETGVTPYTMTLGTGITNPYSESTTLTANTIHQFCFLAVDGNLELQPSTPQAGGGGAWGTITGTLSDQTDLNTALSAKANDSDVVHLAGAETITGVKTFTANSSGSVDGTPAIITPRMRITGQSTSTRVKSQLDLYKGTTKKGYLGYFEENGSNRFEFASESTSVPFYLGLTPWQSKNNYSIALTSQGIWRGGTSDTYSADKVFAVIGDLDKRISSGTAAPSYPTEGQLWYDTTNDALKAYDGTNWNGVGGGDVMVSTQTGNQFTPGMKIWGGSTSDLGNLTQDLNTLYMAY